MSAVAVFFILAVILLAAGVLTIVEGSARRSARVRHGRGVRF